MSGQPSNSPNPTVSSQNCSLLLPVLLALTSHYCHHTGGWPLLYVPRKQYGEYKSLGTWCTSNNLRKSYTQIRKRERHHLRWAIASKIMPPFATRQWPYVSLARKALLCVESVRENIMCNKFGGRLLVCMVIRIVSSNSFEEGTNITKYRYLLYIAKIKASFYFTFMNLIHSYVNSHYQTAQSFFPKKLDQTACPKKWQVAASILCYTLRLLPSLTIYCLLVLLFIFQRFQYRCYHCRWLVAFLRVGRHPPYQDEHRQSSPLVHHYH